MHVVYDIFSDRKLVEQGHVELNKEVRTRTFKYKEEYGDGIIISMAWVKDGRCYSHQVRLEKPLPDKTLNMKWLTFRDRLTPGQDETWKLQITDNKGKAAKAQLMAVLYDKSLDDIAPHSWAFSLPLHRHLPYIALWEGNHFQPTSLYGEEPFHALQEKELDFTKLDPAVLNWNDMYFGIQLMAYAADSSSPRKTRAGMAYAKSMALSKLEATPMGETALRTNVKEAEANDTAAEDKNTKEPARRSQTPSVRQNFNETAFFYPALESDEQGHVSLRFTLPESVTTWKFMGFAHDKAMNYGLEQTEATAQKTLMVMPNMPRFVRFGDQPLLSCRIVNTTDKAQSGRLTLQLVNPENEKVVFAQSRNISINAKETVASTFKFDPETVTADKQAGVLICRMTVEGANFSDGEQHYLPILDNKENVMNTVAFSQIHAGTQTIDVDKLFPVKEAGNRLTIEYTNNPSC